MILYVIFTIIVAIAQYLFLAFCNYDLYWIWHAGDWDGMTRLVLAIFGPLVNFMGTCGLMSLYTDSLLTEINEERKS